MIRQFKYKRWIKIIKKSGLFDVDFYLISYPDVRAADIDPVKHYVMFGAGEGRNPSKDFDTNYYYYNNRDVKESCINPLLHFILHGIKEGRRPVADRVIGAIKNNTVKGAVDKSIKILKDKLGEQAGSAPDFSSLIQKIKFDQTEEKFVEYQEYPPIESKIKAIAFYLPQFHPFPENDEWWGKGFTEWTNVTKAKPNFSGHYQPHLPIHNGFYDLRVPEVMIEQARLAKNYGIHGFNFYYYWFDGKILMHKPFEILLKHKEIDINFCITWANENWTRRWDGAEHDVLMAQRHCDEDSIKFIESLYKFFNDERYIRIDNKPVLIIYRVDIIPNMKETVKLWRMKAKEAGFDGIYLICAQTFGIKSPHKYGFDAAMEFPPHTTRSYEITDKAGISNKDFQGRVYDYNQVVKNVVKDEEENYKLFKTAMLSWDNTARKQNASHIFKDFTLLRFKQWISHIVSEMHNNEKYAADEKLVFINAWNEWAEGTHLEPDRKYGYGYLQVMHDVLKQYDQKNFSASENKMLKKHNDIAVILHVHYTDIWDEIDSYLSNFGSIGFDLYVTTTSTDSGIVGKIRSKYPNADISLVDNRGRDVLPFIKTMKRISGFGYKYACKIHSKKSIYRNDGEVIRSELYDTLLGGEQKIDSIIKYFDEEGFGLVSSDSYCIKHTDTNMKYSGEATRKVAGILGFKFEYSCFAAGTMFWFKPDAIKGIEKLEDKHFDVEDGLVDGTVPHAVERLFVQLVRHNGFKVGYFDGFSIVGFD